MTKPTHSQPPLVSSARRTNQPPVQQARTKLVTLPVCRPQPTPRVLQPKAAAPQAGRTPAAPPVYRPQPVPKCLQPKAATPSQPPAYQPQPAPKVLQKKATVQPPVGTTKRAPVAPPVYSPQPAPKVLQAKKAGGLQTHTDSSHRQSPAVSASRPGTKTIVQPKTAQTSRGDASPKTPPASSPGRVNVVQRRVDNNRRAIGKRIVISDALSDDYRDRGRIVRFSRTRDNHFAVQFDHGRGGLYRVHYWDMDYEEEWDRRSSNNNNNNAPSGSSHSASLPGPLPSSREWEPIESEGQYNNCTDYAFESDVDLALVNDLDKLLRIAETKGYQRTGDRSQATVVLYGNRRLGTYTHAIRRVGGVWQEVQYDGGPMRRYTGSDGPPLTHDGDEIVAMLRRT
ncbi:MAG: hypothetical protein QOJ70_1146 [Acidobacteriota bacterium]|nr:hypothetical protein [Acidobacteriota bacterium]